MRKRSCDIDHRVRAAVESNLRVERYPIRRCGVLIPNAEHVTFIGCEEDGNLILLPDGDTLIRYTPAKRSDELGSLLPA